MAKIETRKVAIVGSCDIHGVGPANDAVLFFDCIDWFVVPKYPNQDWSLITDKFYKRYLRLEELEPARKLMDKIRKIFSTVSSSEVEWREDWQQEDCDKTTLNSKLPTLDLIFLEFFEGFDNVFNSIMYDFNNYGIHHTMRLAICNGSHGLMAATTEQFRPLKQYDSLGDTDKPFWMLPEDEIFKFCEN